MKTTKVKTWKSLNSIYLNIKIKMQGVNIKQTKLFMQAINENKFGYLTLKEHEILDWVLEQAKDSELYNSVGKDIEEYANKLVKEECEPEWNRISEEMKPLGELRNKLAEKKAKGEEWTDENEAQLNWLDKEMSDLSAEYQKVTDTANEKLNKFKEERIAQEEGACFLVEDNVYEFVDKKTGWKVFEKPLNNK